MTSTGGFQPPVSKCGTDDSPTSAPDTQDAAHTRSAAHGFAAFQLYASIDGNLAIATWSPQRFACDAELLQVAQLQVALGEIVAEHPTLGPLRATVSPDEPLALLLTLCRCARVVACNFDLTGPFLRQV